MGWSRPLLLGVVLGMHGMAHAGVPVLATDAATALSPTGAVLNGAIVDTGGEIPSVRGFAYGLSTSYGGLTADVGATQVGAGKRNWNAVAMTPDGGTLVAATGGDGSSSDYLYASRDGGATWTALVSAGKRIWVSIDLSADGSRLVAANNQYVYTSTDAGTTWTQRLILGTSHAFRAVAISPDGAILAAADNDGQNWKGTVLGKIYISTDGGASWTQQTGAGTGYWSQLRFSPDGHKLLAAAGHYYASVYNEQYNWLWTGATGDGGATWAWTRQDGAGQHNWTSATFFAADGSRMAAVDRNTGTIHLSTDSGASWQTDASLGARDWTTIAASADGTRLVLGSYGGYLHSGSTLDNGAHWVWTLLSGTYNVPRWNAAALSDDGGKLVVAAHLSEFLISPTPLQPIASGPFAAEIMDLACDTTYHVAAYATNASGTSYGPDASFTTAACPVSPRPLPTMPATADLGRDMIDEIDTRIAGVSTAQSGFRSLWTTRGNGTDGWQYNVATLWSNEGALPLDFSGASPWNSTMQYSGAGTLISPRHVLFAAHFPPAVGTTMGFVDHENHIVTRKLARTQRIGTTDIMIGVLDADVPVSIAYYPVISHADFQRYVAHAEIPIIRLDKLDTVFIQDIGSVTTTTISTTPSSGARAPYSASGMVGGDSGNPNFAVIGGQLVLLGAHYSANSFPFTGGYIAEINAAMAVLGGGYQLTQLDLTGFTAYVPPSVPSQAMSVVERSAAGTVVGGVRVDGVNGMSALRNFSITAGDLNHAFAIDPNTGVITVSRPELIDFSIVQAFSLTVSVQDSALSPTLATGTVNVSVAYDPGLPHPIVSIPGAFAWTERTASGARNWQNIATSGAGNGLAAIEYGGHIWTSADAGASWTQHTVAGSRGWTGVALSADGQRLAAVDYDSAAVWTATSSDGGVTWTWVERAVGQHTWTDIAASSDGGRLVLVSDDGSIFTSTDAGASWTDRSLPGGHGWWNVTASADGMKLALVDWNGFVYTSADAGANWVDRTPATASYPYWQGIASSADGGRLVLGDGNGYLHTSSDAGATWTTHTDLGSRYWYSVASSSDGNTLAAVDSGGYLYVSFDAGASWAAQAGTGQGGWTAIAASSAGDRLAAVANAAHVWTGALTAGVTTHDPSALRSTSATLNGAVEEIGLSSVTTRGFQYGPTPSYGVTTAETGSFGAGAFTATVSGLVCGGTYHMRAYATNGAGTTYGANRVFSPPCPLTLSYHAGPHGTLAGGATQTVEAGLDGVAVTAVPDTGYAFVAWSDGATANPRTDIQVSADLSVTASFVYVGTQVPEGGSSADVPMPPWAIGLLMASLLGASLRRRRDARAGV